MAVNRPPPWLSEHTNEVGVMDQLWGQYYSKCDVGAGGARVLGGGESSAACERDSVATAEPVMGGV
jgi:hypothetical protein